MAVKYWRWMRRDHAGREEWIETIADFCAKQGKHPSVKWARWFWSGPSEVVVLSEVDDGPNPAETPEIVAAKMRIDDLAHLTAYEMWAEIT